jgi:hypothetical protein
MVESAEATDALRLDGGGAVTADPGRGRRCC